MNNKKNKEPKWGCIVPMLIFIPPVGLIMLIVALINRNKYMLQNPDAASRAGRGNNRAWGWILVGIGSLMAMSYLRIPIGKIISTVFDLLFSSSAVGGVIAAVAVIIIGVRMLKKHNKAANPPKPAEPEPAPAEPATEEPGDYQTQLLHFRAKLPKFSEQIDAAYNQSNSIAKKRGILLDILKRNDADCPDLVETCDQTGDIIAQNIRSILNRLNIVSGIDAKNPHSEELIAKHAEVIEQIIKKNYDILASFDDFLTYTAQMKDKIISEDQGLKATIETLRRFY